MSARFLEHSGKTGEARTRAPDHFVVQDGRIALDCAVECPDFFDGQSRVAPFQLGDQICQHWFPDL